MSKTCFFIGHREAPTEISPILEKEIERHITEYGVTAFIVGMYGRFDSMAAQAVMAAKSRHPEITLTLLLPYHPADRPVEKPDGFDDTMYPSGLERTPRQFAIAKANRLTIDRANFLIAYVSHPASNASKFLEYARRREKQGRIRVSNLNDFL